MAQEPTPFVDMVTSWQFWVVVGAQFIALGGLLAKVRRHCLILAPDRVIERAEKTATLEANFLTAQQDIAHLTARIERHEDKTRQDVKDLHAKIETHLTEKSS